MRTLSPSRRLGRGFVASPLTLGALLVSTLLVPAPPAGAATTCTASSVVSFTQGRQRDGLPVPASRSNPSAALGPPGAGGEASSVSLGFGGAITLRFDQEIQNGSGADIVVREGSGPARRLERAEVFASSDGTNFTLLGTATNQAPFPTVPATSLDLGSLSSARFVKIVDTTTFSLYRDVGDEAGADGFDVESVQGNSCTVTVVKLQCADGLDNDGDGRVDSADPGCHTDGKANNPASFDPNDNLEADAIPQCRDGIDNDGDGRVDLDDPDCSSADDTSEFPSAPAAANITQQQFITGAGAGGIEAEQEAGQAKQKVKIAAAAAAPSSPPLKPTTPAVKGAVTVTAPRPVPLTVPTGMSLGGLLLSLGGLVSVVGAYLFRKIG